MVDAIVSWQYNLTPCVLELVAGVIFSDISLLSDRSRDNVVGIATGYGLDDRGVGVCVPVGSRIFSKLSGRALWFTQWVPEVKRLGCEVYHSPPTSAGVNKMWVHTSTPICLRGIMLN
jgi:hypothetical protein